MTTGLAKPLRFFARWGITLALVLAVGCGTLAPRTAALWHVHEVYRRDFEALVLPSPDEVRAKDGRQGGGFSRTLAAIREVRRQVGTSSAERAHLTVLEGMVYLQSGRIGMARAIEPEVTLSADLLRSRTGWAARDELFARNYAALVQGWDAIFFYLDRLKSGTSGVGAEAAVGGLWRGLTNAAVRLDTQLSGLDTTRLPDAEADQGALYLATCGAIFYTWAVQLYPGADTLDVVRAEWLKRGRVLIGRFLTANEKRLGEEETRWLNQERPAHLPERALDPKAFAEGRWRYVRWYQWLQGNENKSFN